MVIQEATNKEESIAMNIIKRKFKTIFKQDDYWATTAVNYALRGKTFEDEERKHRYQERLAYGRQLIDGNPLMRNGESKRSLMPFIFETLKDIDKKVLGISFERIDAINDVVLLVHPVGCIYGCRPYNRMSIEEKDTLAFLLGYADMRHRELLGQKPRIIL